MTVVCEIVRWLENPHPPSPSFPSERPRFHKVPGILALGKHHQPSGREGQAFDFSVLSSLRHCRSLLAVEAEDNKYNLQ